MLTKKTNIKLAGIEPDEVLTENGEEKYVYKFENIRHRNQIMEMSAEIFFLTKAFKGQKKRADGLRDYIHEQKYEVKQSIPKGSDRGGKGGTREL